MSTYLYCDLVTKPVQVQELVNYLDRLEFGSSAAAATSGGELKESQRTTDYKKLVDNNSVVEVYHKLLEEQDLVLQKGNRGEISSFYAILATFYSKSPQIYKLIERLTSNKTEKKVERLANLGHLFNLFPDPIVRYTIFLSVLEYSYETDQTAAVESQFESIDTRLKEFNATNPQKRRVYDVVLKHVRDWGSVFVYDYWVKYYSAYDDNEPVSSETMKDAESTIISFLKDPEIMRTDLLFDSHVVRCMSKTKIHELLQIFTTLHYHDYISFYKHNTALIEDSGLRHEDLVHKIRMLTLISLASKQPVLFYSEVAKSLEILEEEVEFIVVETINADLLDARIDQLNKRIVIRHAESRVFHEAEWVLLHKKLTKWKDNMDNLLKVIHKAKEGTSSSTVVVDILAK